MIALAGGALLWSVRRAEVKQAERNVTQQARYVSQAILRDELRPSDLSAPVTGARLRHLDWLFTARVLVGGGLRVKLYRGSDGLITYSNDHALIGHVTDDPEELHSALAGHVVRDVTYLNHEGGSGKNVKALEVYTPVMLRGEKSAAGVFELYESYAPVASAVRSFVMPFTLLLLGTLIALWAALFPLINRMVRSLDRVREAHRSTERALVETAEQLRQSQKMEAIGRLAGGVAHDFNNLLLAINGYAELLAGGLTDPRQQKFASEIRSAGDRAAALTAQLLAFSRRQVLEPRVLDLNASITEIETMLGRLIGEDVRVELQLADDLKAIEADPAQIGQVLLNLAVNARDAMSGSGTLHISTRNDGGDVLLEVADTGVGMDEETQARIFDPFFTTKDVGQGTGLGLATVYGIITQSGGTITVRSSPGRGAAFVLRFPATDARPEGSGESAAPTAPSGRERILVVDDETVVRNLVAQVLRERGYDVTVAGSAREALELEGDYDLLLTDVVMPETNGPELAEEIDADRVLFMSGYDQDGVAGSGAPYLQKPFSREQLTHAVRAVLDGAALDRSAA